MDYWPLPVQAGVIAFLIVALVTMVLFAIGCWLAAVASFREGEEALYGWHARASEIMLKLAGAFLGAAACIVLTGVIVVIVMLAIRLVRVVQLAIGG